MIKLFRSAVFLFLSMSSSMSHAQAEHIRTFDNLVIYVSDCSISTKPTDRPNTSFPSQDRLQLACEQYQNEIPSLLNMFGLSIKVIHPKNWQNPHQETPVNEEENFSTKYRLYLRGIEHNGGIHGFGGFFAMHILLQDSDGNRISSVNNPILQGNLKSDESVSEVVENAEMLTLEQMGCDPACFKVLKKKPRN